MSHPKSCWSWAMVCSLCLSLICLAQQQPQKTPEDELASRIVAAKTETERAALLEEKKDLVTVKLARALLAQADRLKVRVSPSASLIIYNLAQSIGEQLGDKSVVAFALSASSDAYYLLSDYPKAIEYAEKSLKISEELGDKAAIARALNVKATPLYLMGDRVQALALYEKSLALRLEVGNKAALALSLNQLGNFYSQQGDYSRAMSYFQEALTLLEVLQNKRGLANTLSSVGLVYYYQDNYALALDYLNKGLALSREIGDKEGIGRGLYNIGITYGGSGQDELALKYYFEVLEIAEAIGAQGPKAMVISSIGESYRDLGRLDEALEYATKSLELGNSLGDPDLSDDARNDLASIYLLRKDYARVLEITGRVIPDARKLKRLERLWGVLYKAGLAYRAMDQTERAREMFGEAIATIELLRFNVAGGEQETQRFIQERIGPYHAMTELLVAQKKPEEALMFSERAKGRVLLDVLQNGRVSINKSMTANEQARERTLTTEIRVLNAQAASAREAEKQDEKQIAELEARLQKARIDHEAFETGLYTSHPELKLKRGLARIINLKQASELLPDSKSALLEFAVTDERVFLFVMTKSNAAADANMKVYSIDVKRKDLATDIENFRRMLAERNPAFKESAKKLYDLLLAPVRSELQGKNNLIIVPDDALWELAFQALQTNQDRFLLEDSAISYAPSLSVLYEMQRQRGTPGSANKTTLLAFGNPTFGDAAAERTRIELRSGTKPVPLPEAEKEVRSLADIYGSQNCRVYVGKDAREDRAKSEAADFRILHFATHGVLNNSSPMYSSLLLSKGSTEEDGLLEAWEIMKLNLNADLVVLSACETARGRIGAGEGIIGLTWALFVAGSPATLVSQWKVDSEATRQLMLGFHRNFKNGGSAIRTSKAEALRQAALKLMRSSAYKHPFNWASFVIVGDNR